jgi:alpha-tubulin suppressor-like RCC1 family protein
MTRINPLVLALFATGILTGCGGDDSSSNTAPVEEQALEPEDKEAPLISGLVPVAEQVFQSRKVVVSGVATDNKSLQTITVEMADVSVVADIDEGKFTAQLDATPGSNSYKVIAEDAAGNISEVTGSFYYGRKVAAGGAHTGVISEGKLYTWGRNNLGQIGNNTMSSLGDITEENPDGHTINPVQISTQVEFLSLSFNQNSSTALDVNGNVWAWGDGDDGQSGLGDGSDDVVDETDYYTPTKISGLENVVAIERGYDHVLVLKNDGTVLAFGDNAYGQLGDGTDADKDTAVTVTGLSGIVQLAASSGSSYAVDEQGRLWSWGRNNYGQLGLGIQDSDDHLVPMQVLIDEKVLSIAAGKAHALALVEGGNVYGWGLNASSQVGKFNGDDTERDVLSPQLLPWFDDAIAVWANGNQSFVQRENQKVYPWGQNGMFGTLGVDTEENVEVPDSPVFGLENVADIAPGAMHTAAVRKDGKVFNWGWSFEGSLGGGESTINRWGYRLPILISLPVTE